MNTKKIVAVFLILAAVVTLAACSGGAGAVSSGSTNVTIAVASPASGSSTKAAPSRALAPVPSAVDCVVVTVTGADMATITADVPLPSGVLVLQVPNGVNRRFVVNAYGEGVLLYRGTSDAALLDGSPVDLGVDMLPLQFGRLTGSVRDASGNTPLAGVGVAISRAGVVEDTLTTGADGAFQASLLEGSGYSIVFTRTGYLPVLYDGITISGTGTTNLEPVLQIDAGHAGTGNVSGTVVNALNGSGVDGLTVNLRPGINVTTGTVVASATTQSGGSYSFTGLAAGNYTCEVGGSGYTMSFFTVTCLGGQSVTGQNSSVSPLLLPGQTRIVLTWGASPSDLDSHLTGPSTDNTRFHIYFGSRTYTDPGFGTVVANLDRDVTSGYGPETTTIDNQIAGVYRFSVHDYTNGSSATSTEMSFSGAQVRVFQNSGLVATFNVPTGQPGTLWTVFEINGTSIAPVNTVTVAPSSGEILAPSRGGGTATNDAGLIGSRPAK